jgi:fatty acid desaturase
MTDASAKAGVEALTEGRLLVRIYGVVHDVTDFAPRHPGGRHVIEQVAANDLPDATPLFESYHALVDADFMRRMLKPMATGETYPQLYSFEENGFYRTLRKRVAHYLHERTGQTGKATGGSWVLFKAFFAFAMWSGLLIGCVVMAAYDWSVHLVLASASLAGVMLLSWGFIMMHEASHFAFADGARINDLFSQIWNSVALWDTREWFTHHVIWHHSFTGDPALDPDMHHGSPVMRTTIEMPKYGAEGAYTMLGHPLLQFFGMMVVPGMYFGQIIMYAWVKLSRKENRQLWTMDLRKIEVDSCVNFVGYLWLPLWFASLARSSSCVLAVAAVMAYFLGCNLAYSINIFPDHDAQVTRDSTDEGVKAAASYKTLPDWGELQARGSASWAGPKWCCVFGGINLQIEHHLFPRVSHTYLPSISPIIRATCKEFNVPYTYFPSVKDAIVSVYGQVLRVHQKSCLES